MVNGWDRAFNVYIVNLQDTDKPDPGNADYLFMYNKNHGISDKSTAPNSQCMMKF